MNPVGLIAMKTRDGLAEFDIGAYEAWLATTRAYLPVCVRTRE